MWPSIAEPPSAGVGGEVALLVLGAAATPARVVATGTLRAAGGLAHVVVVPVVAVGAVDVGLGLVLVGHGPTVPRMGSATEDERVGDADGGAVLGLGELPTTDGRGDASLDAAVA